MGSVAENLAAVEARIKAACTRVGRDPSEVRLLPVSKNQGMDLIAEAYEAGVRLLGENRVQEASEKARYFADHPDSGGRSLATCRPTRRGRWQPSHRVPRAQQSSR